jgi:tRNA pseudouridine38-40 synthase
LFILKFKRAVRILFFICGTMALFFVILARIVHYMPRYFLRISFMGTRYAGWQKQQNALAVQEVLDSAISTILAAQVETTGCGRTDTGVHASKFYVHFDVADKIVNTGDVVYRINAVLPGDIAIHEFFQVHDDAHVRYDATLRQYRYLVSSDKNPFLQSFTCFNPYELDIEAMNAAGKMIIGKGDFASFSKTNSGTKTTICTISEAAWSKENLLVFSISADRFLRGMVRAIVGTMFDVGRGKLAASDVADILQARNRNEAGASVPAQGLFLTNITYPYFDSSVGTQIFPIVT